MLAFQRWIQTSTRGQPRSSAPTSGLYRLVASLSRRLVALTDLAQIDQVLEGLLSDDRTFSEHVHALAELLRGEADGQALPEPAARQLVDLPQLALAVDHATGIAEDAEMMGTASPFQATLRMRASATYGHDGPPSEIMVLIAAYQKVPLALLLLVYLKNHQPDAPEALLVGLARTVREGHLARLAHLAALGYEVPEELVPVDRRLDMEALYNQADLVDDFTLEGLVARLDLPAAHVLEAIAQGGLKARQVGSRYQIKQAHLRAFQQAEQARRQAIVDGLTAEAQSLGLYDL